MLYLEYSRLCDSLYTISKAKRSIVLPQNREKLLFISMEKAMNIYTVALLVIANDENA